ncbi:hypothetical protein AB7315_08855 [Providencia manganoxydans]|uniref:hypothetical protein n=1 Tax=Providencia manganoxydans TaxID=2923283 RepID=UPI0032DB53D3
MSWRIYSIIPKDITYIPSIDEMNKIDEFLGQHGVNKGIFKHEIYKRVQVVVNPRGVGEVTCPSCNELIHESWVFDIIGEIYDTTDVDNKGIELRDLNEKRQTPCCGNFISLTDIDYDYSLRFCSYKAECSDEYLLPRESMEFVEKINRHSTEYLGFPAELFIGAY